LIFDDIYDLFIIVFQINLYFIFLNLQVHFSLNLNIFIINFVYVTYFIYFY